jgi:2-polyprenyl-3-methyl-5-hydroxy-6-metoxy-1,4-benzoquinol methylase
MTAHVYDERVAPGEPVYAAHRARYERADAAIALAARVLDAGCGVGYGAALLAHDGRRVVGIDASPDAVAAADVRSGEHLSFLVADAAQLPFDDASFDAVTCFEVIEHVTDPEFLLSELARVLAPGGLLCLSTPNARMERLHAQRAGREPNPFHISPFVPRTLARALRRHFAHVSLFGQTEDRGRLHETLQSIDPLGLRLRLAPQQRARVRDVLGEAANGSTVAYRFSQRLARSAGITYAEARK